MEAALIGARLLQFAAATGCGTAFFFLYGEAPRKLSRWRQGLALGFVAGAIGSLAWLMAQAGLFGEPRDAFSPARVWSVAADTGFGRAALVRLVLFVLAAGAVAGGRWKAAAGLSALATATFAFGGHAAGSEGVLGTARMAADAVHALAAVIWLGALPPLVAMLFGNPGETASAKRGLDSFSRIGVGVVGALVVTGAINTLAIFGPNGIWGLAHSPYGKLLLAKLALFCGMLTLAAGNRLVWAPRLRHAEKGDQAVITALRGSVVSEAALGFAVLLIVSWLGTLSPTA